MLTKEQAMADQKPIQSNWIIWLQWMLLTSTSKLVVIASAIVLLSPNWNTLWSINALNVVWALSLFAFGAFIAATQWLLLRHYFSGAMRWIVAGGVGMVIGGFLAFPLKLRDLYIDSSGFQLDEIAYGVAFGFLMGAAQWFVMRSWVRGAGRWVLSSTIGWALGMTAGELLPRNWSSTSAGLVYGMVTEGIPVAITGLALVVLLQKHPKPTRILDKSAG
jgi:hypothetical protein